jgi:hypothetical protein
VIVGKTASQVSSARRCTDGIPWPVGGFADALVWRGALVMNTS